MEFRFETKPTFEDYEALNHALSKTLFRKSRTLTRAVFLICGVLMLLAGAMALFVGIGGWGVEQGVVIMPLVAGAIALVCGGIYIYYYCTYDRRAAKRSLKMQEGNRMLDRIVTLTEEVCRVESNGAGASYTYPVIIDLLYCRERYFLVIDKSHAVVLSLADLVEGDPAALESFLEQKLGRPVKKVK